MPFKIAGILSPFSLQLSVILFLAAIASFRQAILLRPISIYIYLLGFVLILQNIVRAGSIFAISSRISNTIVPLLLSYAFFENYKVLSPERKKNIVKYTTLFLVIGLLLNIRGLLLHPEASRLIIGRAEASSLLDYYAKLGISGYGFHAGIPPLIPAFFFLALDTRSSIRKVSFFMVVALIYVATVLSATAANLLVATIALIISLFGLSVFRKHLIIILAVAVLLIVTTIGPSIFVSRGLNTLVVIAPTEGMARRIRDVDLAIQEGVDISGETSQTSLTTFEGRFQRVFWNLEAFSRSPLWGTSNVPPAAGHLYWLYFIAIHGLVAMVPYLILLTKMFQANYREFYSTERYYYSTAIISFVIMGMSKNITSELMFFIPFALVPILINSSKWVIGSSISNSSDL